MVLRALHVASLEFFEEHSKKINEQKPIAFACVFIASSAMRRSGTAFVRNFTALSYLKKVKNVKVMNYDDKIYAKIVIHCTKPGMQCKRA